MSQPIDSRQLRAFASLARTSSFTFAAKELNLTQSAISHSMKALEREIGCRLLDKMGKKVVLTEAGEALLVHVERILGEMALARAELGQLGKWGQSRLRLGASATACQHILPNVLREFRQSFPQCAISIEPGDTPEMIAALRDRRIDLAVISSRGARTRASCLSAPLYLRAPYPFSARWWAGEGKRANRSPGSITFSTESGAIPQK